MISAADVPMRAMALAARTARKMRSFVMGTPLVFGAPTDFPFRRATGAAVLGQFDRYVYPVRATLRVRARAARASSSRARASTPSPAPVRPGEPGLVGGMVGG